MVALNKQKRIDLETLKDIFGSTVYKSELEDLSLDFFICIHKLVLALI